MKKFDKVYRYYDGFMRMFNLYKIDNIIEALNLKGHETILDIGGGTGRLAASLKHHCKKVYVLDESEKMLSKLDTSENVIPVKGDAFDLSIIEDVDVVILSDVYHHIKDQERLLDVIHHKINNGGHLLIMDFDRRHYKVKILRMFEYLLFGKLYFRTPEELMMTVRKNFEIIDYHNYDYYFIVLGEKND